jgi:hypothetical protein
VSSINLAHKLGTFDDRWQPREAAAPRRVI